LIITSSLFSKRHGKKNQNTMFINDIPLTPHVSRF
jgi:hypothetical protein